MIIGYDLESTRVVTVRRAAQPTYPIAVFLRGSQYLVALGVPLNLTVLLSDSLFLLRRIAKLDGYIADIRMNYGYHTVELTLFSP